MLRLKMLVACVCDSFILVIHKICEIFGAKCMLASTVIEEREGERSDVIVA